MMRAGLNMRADAACAGARFLVGSVNLLWVSLHLPNLLINSKIGFDSDRNKIAVLFFQIAV